MGSTRPNPTNVSWVGSKNPLNPTQPDPCTPLMRMHELHASIYLKPKLKENSIN